MEKRFYGALVTMISEKTGITTSQAALASFYASTYLLLLGPLAIYANNLTEFSHGLAPPAGISALVRNRAGK